MPPPGFAGAAFLSAPRCQTPSCEALQAIGRRTNKNKGSSAMWKQAKYRQATLIVLATTVILILPNVTRLVS
ncbi:hypothetical protein PA6_044_00110 [Aquipseudomonas alcaligenes NBRC 14159]|uniref:Uncharacterized protein n=1 Tax=Aquipseudomonas alcaligenes (strain ATCC 14909 / DSM 50342 / CCUG 1425 / JCM 20561 / NBRC 14159 / NCIMB 9945 / NCTC 10367 / 1577) TaxID=1215092 RepID=U2ZT86_AQUA1|nr:hypothetical protein PA6_044_00110 [Pseudomonas alcaligenes NBRC 14159]